VIKGLKKYNQHRRRFSNLSIEENKIYFVKELKKSDARLIKTILKNGLKMEAKREKPNPKKSDYR